MKEKTFLHLHRNDVSMTLGGGSNGHPLSIHSASFGTSRKPVGNKTIIRYMVALFLLLFSFGVGNAWATIDWTNYAVDKEGLVSGEEYYIYTNNTSGSYTTNHFVTAPASYPTTSAGRSNYVTDNYANATLFTFTKNNDGTYVISYDSNKYFNENWGTYKSSGLANWNTTSANWTIDDVTVSTTTYKNTLKTGTKWYFVQKNSSSTFMTTTTSTNRPFWPYMFIHKNAYKDATATNQYYWRANANASEGGTAVVAKTTYKKPAKSNLTYPADYATYVTGQKGNDVAAPTITVYYNAEAASGYHFLGWYDAAEGGSALSTDAEYTYSFTATTAGSGNSTVKNIYARFEEDAAAAAVYTGGTGEPTPYTTLGAALTAAADGDLIVLQGNIGELQTISKNITLDFNGYKIQGSSTNMVEITGNVTFVDNSLGTPGGVTTTGATAVLVSGGSLTIKDGMYVGATYAVERTGGSVTIKNGGFTGGMQDINGTVTLNGGFFIHNTGLSVGETYAVVSDIPTGMKYSANDYNYMVVAKNSPNYPVCVVISESESAPTIRQNFNTLAGAIAYVNNANDETTNTILMREDHTLQAGNYTIPTNAILVIPYSAEQTAVMPNIRLVATNNVPRSAYCALTLASGAHIDVLGAIEVGGLMTGGSIDAAGENGISRPGGDTYGLMQMNAGSSITFYEDANLYAWGFIVGEGTIDMRRGAVAREQFQMYDWKGFMPTATMAAGGSVDYTYHVLPINQYHIQNIEVKTTYRPGSKLYGQVGAYIPSLSTAIGFNDIGIIGVKYSDAAKNANPNLEDDVAIFLMDNEDDSEDTWVRKSYDVDNDVQLYEANNSAYLGSLVMEIDLEANNISIGNPFNNNEPIDGLDVDSRDFALPITNNFKIHLLSGTLVVTQNTELLPGAVIEVDKNSTMTIEDHVWRVISGVNTWIESPQTLYLYDKDQWGTYVFVNKEEDTYNFGYASRVRTRPGEVKKVNDQYVRDISSPESLGDAKLIVHGTVDVKGYLKTTQGDKTASPVFSQTLIPNTNPARYIYKVTTSIQTSTLDPQTEGGASIISTIVDAGTINLLRHSGTNSSAYVNNYIWQIGAIGNVNKDEPDYYGDHVIAALLKNADGSYTDTKGKSSGQSYCYIDFNGVGTWKNLTADGCFVYEVVENETVYYAKPREYVALANGKTENADHTYTSATGDRTFILMDDCQWWEVEPVAERPDLFHCTHPQNDMYYYWDGSKWTEKRYTVTWKDWDGTTWDTYSLKYGVQPKFLGNVPGRAKDDYYTYDFVGWSPEITNSTIVTSDVTYTAQYDRKDVMYTVTWKDEGDNIIEIGYFKMGEVPTCTSADMTNKEWTPAVGAVTGNTIYQLQAKNIDGPFDIKFMNWNGSQIGLTQSVAKDDAPVAPADPSKPALTDIEFVFAGWRAANNEVYASNAIPAAKENAVYTATFQEKPITYKIIWKNSDGSVLETDENVGLNVVPQYNGTTPVRPEDGENYTFAGWEPTVVAATENAEYVAKYIAKDKIVDGETYTVPASTHVPVTTITIKDDGVVSVPSGSLITATTLILESSGSMSGELIATNDRIHATNAYFDLAINAVNHTWYGFAVPWQVDAENGISVNGRTLELGKDFDIIYYDGARRANEGKQKCWSYVENDGDKTLQPGRLYMLALMGDAPVIRFAKKEGAVLLTTSTEVKAHPSAVTTDANWNGVANPALFHAYVNAGSPAGQVYDPATKGYMPITMSDAKMVVGQGAFIQTPTTTTVTVTYGGAYAAPRRNRTSEMLDLRIAPMDKQYTDRLFLQMDEDKEEDTYIIAQDLVKVGVSSQVAQMWVNRYNAQLCMNTIAPTDGKAEYPLGISVPTTGEYTISLMPNEENTVYLTRDGQAIWNLSDGAYTMTLNDGKYTNYGIRVGANAPQVTTGIDEAVVDAKGETRKVLIDNQVFIIRGEQVYTIDGQLVK